MYSTVRWYDGARFQTANFNNTLSALRFRDLLRGSDCLDVAVTLCTGVLTAQLAA